MAPKKELCRNFMRGSCQYGERCRYLHAAQTPSKSSPFGGNQFQNSNPFGFGVQSGNQTQQTNSRQQAQNPFGFGVQNNSQPRGGFSDFGSKQNQNKPFQNTWVRDQSNAGGQPNHQSAKTNGGGQPKNQSAPHKCTDSESCKRLIAEDFQNERPLWKLSCYSHLRDGPCDIVGDVSYEELRAAAYDDVRRGLGLPAIAERERNLLSSKLQEYNALIHNYKVPVNSAFGVQSPFHNNVQNTSTIAGSRNPPTLSSFTHLATALNTGFSAPPTSLFGQPNPFQNTSHSSGTFTSHPSGAFTSHSSGAFTPPGSFGNRLPSQGFGSTGFGNSSATSQQNPVFPSTQVSGSAVNFFNGSQSGGSTMDNTNLNLNMPPGNVDEDDDIWTKETWTIGKIPESAPPVRYCQ